VDGTVDDIGRDEPECDKTDIVTDFKHKQTEKTPNLLVGE